MATAKGAGVPVPASSVDWVQIEAMLAEVKESTKASRETNAAVTASAKTMAENSAQTNVLVGELSNKLGVLGATNVEIRDELVKNGQGVNQLTDNVGKLVTAMGALPTMNTKLDTLATGMERASNSFDDLRKEVRTAGGKVPSPASVWLAPVLGAALVLLGIWGFGLMKLNVSSNAPTSGQNAKATVDLLKEQGLTVRAASADGSTPDASASPAPSGGAAAGGALGAPIPVTPRALPSPDAGSSGGGTASLDAAKLIEAQQAEIENALRKHGVPDAEEQGSAIMREIISGGRYRYNEKGFSKTFSNGTLCVRGVKISWKPKSDRADADSDSHDKPRRPRVIREVVEKRVYVRDPAPEAPPAPRFANRDIIAAMLAAREQDHRCARPAKKQVRQRIIYGDDTPRALAGLEWPEHTGACSPNKCGWLFWSRRGPNFSHWRLCDMSVWGYGHGAPLASDVNAAGYNQGRQVKKGIIAGAVIGAGARIASTPRVSASASAGAGAIAVAGGGSGGSGGGGTGGGTPVVIAPVPRGPGNP